MGVFCKTAHSLAHRAELQRSLKKQFDEQKFCDVTITTGNNHSICSHKLILIASSSVLEEQLENSENVDGTPYSIDVIKIVLGFLYNGEGEIDENNIMDVVKLSSEWNINPLKKSCMDSVRQLTTLDNACEFYEFAIGQGNSETIEYLNYFIRKHFQQLHESHLLDRLSMDKLSNLIDYDHINVKHEDYIYKSAIQSLALNPSPIDMARCFQMIRYEYMTLQYLLKDVINHPAMQHSPQNEILNRAIQYHYSKDSMTPSRPVRSWLHKDIKDDPEKELYSQQLTLENCMYINKGNKICVYDSVNRYWNEVIDLPKSVLGKFSKCMFGANLFIAGGNERDTELKSTIMIDLVHRSVTPLADLPEEITKSGMVCTGDYLYVIGGSHTSKDSSQYSCFRLDFAKNKWESIASIQNNVIYPLVVEHNNKIYVFGSQGETNSRGAMEYDIESNAWKTLRSMPRNCNSYQHGVVVFKDQIFIITPNRRMVYDIENDTWEERQYNSIGDVTLAVIFGDAICACVGVNKDYSFMKYDVCDNTWSIIIDRIPNFDKCIFYTF